jgi:hypothetical protein
VAAAYKTDILIVEGPYQPVFKEFQLGVLTSRLGFIEGVWGAVGGVERTEGRFQTFGLNAPLSTRVDALWIGDIVARTVPIDSQITQVETQWPDGGSIDAEIVAALGNLPSNPQLLEQERRNRFLTRIRTAFDQPTSFTNEIFDQWLESVGAASVGDLLTRFHGTVQSGAVQVAFSPPAAAPPLPRALPITAAILIRDVDFSIAQLLMESKILRESLEKQGLERPPNPSLPVRYPILVIWIVPITVFDAADWPGGQPGMSPEALRNARRLLAGQWLAREGIGLAATLP